LGEEEGYGIVTATEWALEGGFLGSGVGLASGIVYDIASGQRFLEGLLIAGGGWIAGGILGAVVGWLAGLVQAGLAQTIQVREFEEPVGAPNPFEDTEVWPKPEASGVNPHFY